MTAPTDPDSFPPVLPVPDADSAPYWDGCRNRTLLVQQCSHCHTRRFPAAPVCHACWCSEHRWTEVDGVGTVFSWVTVEHPVWPLHRHEVPYVIALVELEAGVRIPARLLDVGPHDVRAGLPVEVSWIALGDSINLPAFRPQPV
jgi:uncharacterized OB-fold protein